MPATVYALVKNAVNKDGFELLEINNGIIQVPAMGHYVVKNPGQKILAAFSWTDVIGVYEGQRSPGPMPDDFPQGRPAGVYLLVKVPQATGGGCDIRMLEFGTSVTIQQPGAGHYVLSEDGRIVGAFSWTDVVGAFEVQPPPPPATA